MISRTLCGYARASLHDPDNAAQTLALRQYGVAETAIHRDGFTGRAGERPGWAAVSAALKPGSTLVVQSLDRLGRTTAEIGQTIADLAHRHIDLVTLLPLLDTRQGGNGPAILASLAAVAGYEDELRAERMRAGPTLKLGKAALGGRPRLLTDDDIADILEREAAGWSTGALAAFYGVSRETLRASKVHFRQRQKVPRHAPAPHQPSATEG